MSTVISTNNLAYTATQLVDVNGGSIIRQPTATSADTFPTAASIITAFLGVSDPNYTGNSFTVTIVNESAFTITQSNIDATLTFVPEYTVTSVVIAPGQTVTFTFIQTDDTPEAIEVYTLSKGTIAGPAAAPFGTGATDNALVRFDGATGGLTQNSVVIVGDTGIVTGVLDLTASGTIRANTAFVMEETGAGTDTITLQAPASIAASYTLTFPVDDGTAGQFLQTDGNGVLTWANNASGDALFYQYGPAASVALSGTFTVVDIDTGGVVDATYYTNTNGVVTLSTTGVYEVAFWVQFETLSNAGGAEASFAGQLFLNGAAVVGSISECWTTEANGNLKRPGTGKNIILSITAADTLEVRVQRSSGTTTAQTRINESSLMIIRLR